MAYTIAGIDVHKRMLAVVVSELAADAEDAFARRPFGSTPAQLRLLAAWLSERQVDEVVMESTAQYWRPVWAALERHWTPRARARAGLASNWPAPRRRSFPRSAGIFDPESAALSSVIFGPPFSLSPSVTLARSGFTFSVESRSCSRHCLGPGPRPPSRSSWASLGLAPSPAHRPVWSEPYVRRLGGMMDIPGGVAIKTRAS